MCAYFLHYKTVQAALNFQATGVSVFASGGFYLRTLFAVLTFSPSSSSCELPLNYVTVTVAFAAFYNWTGGPYSCYFQID